MKAAIVYLHGVGQGVRSGEWHIALSQALAELGVDVPPIDSAQVISPDYVDLLKLGFNEKCDEPARSKTAELSAASRLTLIAEFKRRQTRLTSGLEGISTSSVGWGFGRGVDPSNVPLPSDLDDARRYLASKQLQHAILQRVLSRLGNTREIVIIGHSLGSVVAIDLLNHLPPGVRVRGVVTIGSPAGAVGFHKSDMGRLLREFPYSQVDTWVNFLAPADIVTRAVGLAPLFPAAHDVRITSLAGASLAKAHAVTTYVRHPAVAEVLARLLADRVRQPPVAESAGRAVDLRLDEEESQITDGILFGSRIAGAIKNEGRRNRFELALREVAMGTGAKMAELRTARGRSIPPDLAALSRNGNCSREFSSLSIDQQLHFVIVAATSNLIAPYEIDVQAETERAVRTVWSSDFGYSESDGDTVIEALESASGAFRSAPWNRVVVGAVGLGLLAAGPVGLMFAAPAGLAGGAAIVSALAAGREGWSVGWHLLAGWSEQVPPSSGPPPWRPARSRPTCYGPS